jgi:hypothetical protein
MQPRLFSLEEATALLPAVRALIVEIQARKRDLDRLSELLERQLDRTAGNGHVAGEMALARRQMEETAAGLERLMSDLQALGCELKGIEEGLADFPSLREGRVVYLCWRLGEDAIEYWHDLDTGFAGRQLL